MSSLRYWRPWRLAMFALVAVLKRMERGLLDYLYPSDEKITFGDGGSDDA